MFHDTGLASSWDCSQHTHTHPSIAFPCTLSDVGEVEYPHSSSVRHIQRSVRKRIIPSLCSFRVADGCSMLVQLKVSYRPLPDFSGSILFPVLYNVRFP